MNKFEEAIIHIGTGKTATKTLQYFFTENRLRLSRNGILYPRSFGKLAHIFLTAALCDFNKMNDGQKKELGLTDRPKIEKFRDEILSTFRKEIKMTNCTKLLISTESLYQGLTTIEEIKRLKDFLDEFIDKYKIIFHIRPQHELQISNFSTMCLHGNTDKQILFKDLKLHYEKLIDLWANVFNDENIFPKIFSKKEFPDGNIKKDFILFLGLKWNDFEDTENRNESINADAQRFLLEINHYLPKFIENKLNPYRESLRLGRSLLKGKGLIPSRKECEDYFRIYAESNERFRKKWFPERRELFEVDFSKYPEKVQKYPEIDSSFFEIFAKLWTAQQAEFLRLQNKLSEIPHAKEKITQLYLKHLKRHPDPTGLNLIAENVMKGQSLDWVETQIKNSKEYKSLNP